VVRCRNPPAWRLTRPVREVLTFSTRLLSKYVEPPGARHSCASLLDRSSPPPVRRHLSSRRA
jgi:hypothetical protein